MSDVEPTPPNKRRKGCLIALGVVAFALVSVGVFYGPAVADFVRVYGLDSLMKPEKHKYSATSEENLKAIYQGMMLFHESEGQFPNADEWMDDITNRLKTNDLERGEAEKKLIRPEFLADSGKFAGKYKDDITDKSKTPLVYESKGTAKNASGDPASDRDGLAIAVDGTILR
jgi:hypothetical protein